MASSHNTILKSIQIEIMEKPSASISRLENPLARLERLKENRDELTRVITILTQLNTKKTNVGNGKKILFSLGVLAILVVIGNMILRERRFNNLFDELAQVEFNCAGEEKKQHCDERLENTELSKGGLCKPIGMSKFCKTTVQLEDPCASILEDLCSFGSGVLNNYRLFNVLLFTVIVIPSILVLIKYIFWMMGSDCSPCSAYTKLSKEDFKIVQSTVNKYSPLSVVRNRSALDHRAFLDGILTNTNNQITDVIAELKEREDRRLAFVMGVNDKKSHLTELFRSNLYDRNLINTIFEMADVDNCKAMNR